MKHTSGPWYAVYYAGFWNIQDGPYYRDKSLLNEEVNPNAQANAQLAAAAPDLLEAIKYYFDVLKEVNGPDWDKVPNHVVQKFILAYNKATE